jgi:hypothetical protein
MLGETTENTGLILALTSPRLVQSIAECLVNNRLGKNSLMQIKFKAERSARDVSVYRR